MAKDGYTFVGWYIAVVDDGAVTGIGNVFDLANDTVESELCNTTGTAIGSTYKMLQLVAVFEDAEGAQYVGIILGCSERAILYQEMQTFLSSLNN